jgi:hypothetical protein
MGTEKIGTEKIRMGYMNALTRVGPDHGAHHLHTGVVAVHSDVQRQSPPAYTQHIRAH